MYRQRIPESIESAVFEAVTGSQMKLAGLVGFVLAVFNPEVALPDPIHRLGTGATSAPPVAVNDTVVMHHGQKARIAVLANDTGNINSNTVTIQTPPSAGSVTVEATGFVRYTNTNAGAASDSFRYTVAGSGGYIAAGDG